MEPAMKHLFLVAIASVALTACASRPSGPPRELVEQILSNAPGQAQPSKIVATEVAFEQAAVADGQWTAFRRFAAPDAVLHTPSGPVDAGEWLRGRDDPQQSVRWNPRGVWVSCDARLAVSRGRLETPEGLVGTFVTVWQLQQDGSYRWAYDVGAPDDPQPEPVPSDVAPEDLIVVEAIESIQGHVADCPTADAPLPPPPMLLAQPPGARVGVAMSPDGSLRWAWEHGAGGQRAVWVQMVSDGGWQRVMHQRIPGPIEGR